MSERIYRDPRQAPGLPGGLASEGGRAQRLAETRLGDARRFPHDEAPAKRCRP